MGSLHVISGADPVLVADRCRSVVAELVGEGDRSLLVEEVTEAAFTSGGEVRIAPLVDAAQTPPFLTDRRIVVGRNLAIFATKESVAPLVDYLDAALETTELVLVWERGADASRTAAMPASLKDAVARHGATTHDTSVPRGAGLNAWVEAQAAQAGVRLARDAVTAIVAHLGNDQGRLPGLLGTLASAFGPARELGVAEVEPYLGEAGDVAPWDLTDAIGRGDVGAALEALARSTGAGGRHPLQILASLHQHYGRLLRLDGAGVRGEQEAAALLGMKGSTFPAKKALSQLRRLGRDRVARAVRLLAQADLDLRGQTALDEHGVLEVVVARLASLHR